MKGEREERAKILERTVALSETQSSRHVPDKKHAHKSKRLECTEVVLVVSLTSNLRTLLTDYEAF